MFVVEIVATLTTILFLRDLVTGGGNLGFSFQINLWLWFTVLFANFAEAVAEGRGKAQAASLRQTKTDAMAKLLIAGGATPRSVAAASLKPGDIVLVEAGDLIPSDGDVIEGVASVNEAAITGESAPVIRESGGDRSAVTGGTTVISDWIKVKITAAHGQTFLDRMIALVEGAERQKTPNEIALNILLAGPDHHLRLCGRHHSQLRGLCRRPHVGAGAGGAVRHPDPHHHRRAAVGHRHRRHGPAGALQCAGHVGPRGGSGGRRGYAAARQDRHHHAWATARRREFLPLPGVAPQRSGRRGPDCRRCRTRPRKAAPSSCWPRKNTAFAAATWRR